MSICDDKEAATGCGGGRFKRLDEWSVSAEWEDAEGTMLRWAERMVWISEYVIEYDLGVGVGLQRVSFNSSQSHLNRSVSNV